jgi:nitrogen regulatory protein PII
MQLHRKKRIEIVVEAAVTPALIEALRNLGVSGYTIFPALAGSGHHGRWSENAMTAAMQMQAVMIIASPDLTDSLIDSLRPLLSTYKAILMVSDVEVIRGDHFA